MPARSSRSRTVGQLGVGQRECPQPEVGRGVRDGSEHKLDRLDDLVDEDLREVELATVPVPAATTTDGTAVVVIADRPVAGSLATARRRGCEPAAQQSVALWYRGAGGARGAWGGSVTVVYVVLVDHAGSGSVSGHVTRTVMTQRNRIGCAGSGGRCADLFVFCPQDQRLREQHDDRADQAYNHLRSRGSIMLMVCPTCSSGIVYVEWNSPANFEYV